MNFWQFISNTASIASLIAFPVGLAGSLAAFIAWANKAARIFIALVVLVFMVLFSADIAVRAGWFSPALEDIHDKVFRNERVLLDGKRFTRCKFINVTFVINGTAPIELIENTIEMNFAVTSDDSKIKSAIYILNGLGMIRFSVLDKNNKVVPPFGENPKFS